MTKELLFEHMIRVETDQYICRIWRQFGEDGISNEALCEEATRLMLDNMQNETFFSIAMHSRVNSVEIVDRRTGAGVCVHVDWP